MKLIYAEELMAKVNSIRYLRKRRAQMLCDECREVRAIPIEWIKKWVDNIKNDNRYKSEYIELNGDITHIVYKGTEITRVPCITDMLKDWEKENEQERADTQL